ncbi:DNA-3-methyladenine glycosylase family protein [Roseococcus sp. DSY-14]|uniref:DNA-3-methyladenine glycosylase family protein n=1 Tax=Roseococcus sp. DSY-14 TaxID=3369650 RepID=UPI00387B5EEF
MDPCTSSLCACAPPSDWFAPAWAALREAEPAFARVAGPLPYVARAPGFPGLLKTICGQHVSHAAAQAVWARLSAIPGALEPAQLVLLDDDALCGLGGLTRARAATVRAAARAVMDGTLDFARLARLDDAAATAMLVAVKGIGPWTAEVHLVLSEGRPDVFPAGDVALAAGAAHLLGLPARPDPRALRRMAQAWSPWRSVAARALWHHWLHVTGRPPWTQD